VSARRPGTAGATGPDKVAIHTDGQRGKPQAARGTRLPKARGYSNGLDTQSALASSSR